MSLISDRKDGVDMVNHPPHYAAIVPGVECIQISREFNFNCGNVIKYIWRAGAKAESGLDLLQKQHEDLKKARFYLLDEIKRFENHVEFQFYSNMELNSVKNVDSYIELASSHLSQNRIGIITEFRHASRCYVREPNDNLLLALDYLESEITGVGQMIENEKIS